MRRRMHRRRGAAIAAGLVCAGTAAIAPTSLARAAGTADIAVTLRGPSSVNEGEEAVYSAVVYNAGPDPATGVVVTDQVPQGFTFDPSQSFSTCAQNGATVTCPLDEDIPVGLQLAPQISFKTTATGTYTNTVSATETATDPTLDDNTAAMDTTVNPPVSADVSVALQAPAQIYAGQRSTMTMVIQNNGPDTSTGATVSLSFPQGITPDSMSGCDASTSPQTCTEQFGAEQPGEGEWTMIWITATSAGSQTITATVTGDVADPDQSNNSASATVNVQPAADLGLTGSATPNPVTAGHKVTETIVLTNDGPSPATAVAWSTSWSSDAKGGIAFKSADISSGTCSLSGASLSCQPGDMTSGEQVVLTIMLQPRSKGTLLIDSSASSPVYDPAPANDSTETSVTIS